MDKKKLLDDLNAALAKHQAQICIMGYECEVWINHENDDWAHEEIRLSAWDGRLYDVKELH